MDKVDSSIRMGDYMMVSGRQIKCMEQEYYIMVTIKLHIMDNGFEINSMVMAFFTMRIQCNQMKGLTSKMLILITNIGLNMKENSKMIVKMDMAYTCFPMANNFKDSLKRIASLVKDHTFSKMALLFKESGKIIYSLQSFDITHIINSNNVYIF